MFDFLSRLFGKQSEDAAEEPPGPPELDAPPEQPAVPPVPFFAGTDVAHLFLYHPADLAHWKGLTED